MKKIYLTAVTALAMAFTVNAQIIEDNFDSYTLGDISPQAAHWETWPGGTAADVVDSNAFSGTQSMLISDNGTDDQLLLLGDQTSGVYSVSFRVFIPTGATGFYNFQQEEANPGAQFNGQVFISDTASGGTNGNFTYDFDPTETPFFFDTWFPVVHVIDLDNGTITIQIDGVTSLDAVPYVNTAGDPATQLGSMDFFSIDANNMMFVDDVDYRQGNVLSNDEFSATNFSVYPNPVKDVLNIESATAVDSIEVYDVLGKRVLTASPDRISPSIDMSALTSGAYMVKVTIGNASKTVKVIK
ncbi:MAG: T9SS type A sorting domain-containing protein [Flavobacteriales bacterium]|jgi:hypothetical protein|uniref:T9SS type A sorting domain-containing protein n=1 Tax=Candidatus Ulvibacter alkanivorans TaxID=2267620 RepID=UPI000DF42A9F|nr:T9SS type A sorting domain-containing protein [Candidatus Ulvibacter alkanivorans]MCH2489607.1 T9SS type A sorting domain-containing protein [Flavobacteriales bacterium]